MQTAAHEIGTGVYTVMAQTGRGAARRAARTRSTVELGDSDAAAGAGGRRLEHDREHLLGGDEGLRAIRDKLFHAAAAANDGPLAGRSPSEFIMTDGRAVAPDGAADKLDDAVQARSV